MSRILVALLLCSMSAPVAAQFSGSSFGGSRGFGSSSSSSSSYSSSSSWGSSSSSSYSDRQAERREAERRERDRQRAAEAAARREAERREAEARAAAEAARRRRQLEADRALPASERAQLDRRFEDLPVAFARVNDEQWPETRTFPDVGNPGVERTTPERIGAFPERLPDIRLDWLAGALTAGPSFLLFALLALFVRARRARREIRLAATSAGGGVLPAFASRPRSKRRGSCELRRISVAFDWTQRAKLQQVLENVGKRHDVQSEHGMYAAAKDVARILSAALSGARYAMWESRYAWPNDAEQTFFALANDLKSRYRYDTKRGNAPEGAPNAEEGEGLVVVSLVLGSTRRFPDLPSRFDASALAQALVSWMSVSARELVAVEVVWSPALERDRMSSAELVEVYPELLPLAAAEGLGRVQCGHCSGIFAGELTRCPVCGAPRQ